MLGDYYGLGNLIFVFLCLSRLSFINFICTHSKTLYNIVIDKLTDMQNRTRGERKRDSRQTRQSQWTCEFFSRLWRVVCKTIKMLAWQKSRPQKDYFAVVSLTSQGTHLFISLLNFPYASFKPWWLSLLFSRNVFCVTLWCDSLKSLRGVEGSLSYSTFSSRGTAAPARKKIIWNYWSSWKRLQSHSWQSRRELQHRVNERPFLFQGLSQQENNCLERPLLRPDMSLL